MASKKDKEVKIKEALAHFNVAASKKQGWLTKLGGTGVRKNWRSRWFCLSDSGVVLYFTDDTTSKVKGVIQLSDYTTCEPTREDRKSTFAIYHKGKEEQRRFLVQASNDLEMNEWVKAIRQALERINNIALKYGAGVFRRERSFYIKIAEARKLGAERDTYCTVSIDNVQKARTPTVWKADTPMYLQEYDMDLDPNATCAYVYIKEQNKKEKKQGKERNVFGMVEIPLSLLEDGKPLEKWFEVKHPETEEKSGEVRLVVQYQQATVLPDSSYDEFFHLLLVDHMALTKMLGAVSVKKEKVVADCLVKAFEMRKTGVHYVKEITESEINNTPDPNIIFRGNTVGTKSVDIYMRLVGMPYLHYILKPIIDDIYKGKKSCEVDIQRLLEINPKEKEAQKMAQKNLQTLIGYVSQIFESIRKSFLRCPASFRNIFEHIQLKVTRKFPNDPVIRYTAPSGFIFLRFFCPALLGPKLFGLAAEHPPMAIARDLTLIAKTLQNLANLVPFGKKEPYMADVNKFIEDNMPSMRDFIDKLCSPPTEPIDELPSKAQINFGREMARIHLHILASFDAMKEKFGENDAKLIKLFDILQKLDIELEEVDGQGNSGSLGPPLVLHQRASSDGLPVITGLAPSTGAPSVTNPTPPIGRPSVAVPPTNPLPPIRSGSVSSATPPPDLNSLSLNSNGTTTPPQSSYGGVQPPPQQPTPPINPAPVYQPPTSSAPNQPFVPPTSSAPSQPFVPPTTSPLPQINFQLPPPQSPAGAMLGGPSQSGLTMIGMNQNHSYGYGNYGGGSGGSMPMLGAGAAPVPATGPGGMYLPPGYQAQSYQPPQLQSQQPAYYQPPQQQQQQQYSSQPQGAPQVEFLEPVN